MIEMLTVKLSKPQIRATKTLLGARHDVAKFSPKMKKFQDNRHGPDLAFQRAAVDAPRFGRRVRDDTSLTGADCQSWRRV
jgi:hypothetical protein